MTEPTFFELLGTSPLLRNAALAGALAGLACACLSPLVVLRRMAFVGDGMAHAAFGGLGLALLLIPHSRYEDISVQLFTLGFCVVAGVAIGRACRRGDAEELSEDSAIGVVFSVSMAVGALCIALRQKAEPQYMTSMDTYLFGSLLNIGAFDLALLAVVAAAVVAAVVLLHKELLFYTFDARLAETSGLNTGLLHYLFMLLLVLAVVVSSRVVGIVLVSAALVLPGLAALKLCKRLGDAMALASAIGVASFLLGLYLSYVLAIQSAAIILVQFALLLLAHAIAWWRGGNTRE